jgi:hypothetical protein
MSLLDELETFVDYFSVEFPEISIERQNIPADPAVKTLFIRFSRTDSTPDTAATFLNSRMWELIYYGDSTLDVLDVMERIKSSLHDQSLALQVKNSDNYIRVRYFNFSAPFVDENNRSAIIGVMRADTREVKPQIDSGKINEVTINQNN